MCVRQSLRYLNEIRQVEQYLNSTSTSIQNKINPKIRFIYVKLAILVHTFPYPNINILIFVNNIDLK